MNIELKGGVVKEYEMGTTPAEIAKSIGMGLYKSVCAAKVNGVVCDLRTPISEDSTRSGIPRPTFWRRLSRDCTPTPNAPSAPRLKAASIMILTSRSPSPTRICRRSRLR